MKYSFTKRLRNKLYRDNGVFFQGDETKYINLDYKARRNDSKNIKRDKNYNSRISLNSKKKSGLLCKFCKYIATGIGTSLLVSNILFNTTFKQPDPYITNKIKDNVKVVKNKKEPYFGDLTFDLEIDLNISDKASKKFEFHNIGNITLDNQENIYALDIGKNQVIRFDKTGNYLQKLGRKGQGPGEFERPSNLFIDNQHNLYVSDQRKLSIFNSSGKFVKSVRLDYGIQEFFVDSESHIIAISHIITEEETKKGILKFDINGKKVREMVIFPDIRAITRKDKEEKRFNIKVYHEYNYWPYLYPITSQKFIYAYPFEYKMFKMDIEGELELIIEKEESPKSISSKEKRRIVERIEEHISRIGRRFPRELIENACQFPPHRPFFNRILVDDKERIYVRRVDSILDKSEVIRFDIFGEDGYYLYKTKLPFTPEIIRKGHIYDIYYSEELDDIGIKRYKVKNWSDIKSSLR